MESLEFSEDEIKRQLAALGYFNVSEERMKQFRKDLHKLIEHDRSTSGSSSWFTGVSSPSSNSDYSETSSKANHTQQPGLSRFQPHRKYFPRQEFAESRGVSQTDSSSMAQPEVNRLPFRTDTDSSPDGLRSITPELNRSRGKATSPLSPESHNFVSELPLWEKKTGFERSPVSGNENSSAMEAESDSESLTSTTTGSNLPSKVVRRRKVLRKQSDGTPRVYDESLVEDSNRGLYRIHDVSVDDSDPRLTRATQRHHLPPRPHSTRPTWRKDPNFETFVSSDQPPSYIRPNTSNPHTRNLKKTDPVNRHRQYQDFWNNLKAPGEKTHKALRWEVKAQMMYKEELAPKPQRVYVPNSYVVPTSKKRSALRWEVRHALENGLPIPTAFDVY